MGKYGTLSGSLLTAVGEATGFFSWPFEYSEGWRRQQLAGASKKSCKDTLYRLKHKGLVKVVTTGGLQFLTLTQKGELEILFSKAQVVKTPNWDGKWRIMIFDIPEDVRHKRDQLRDLLKRNNFVKLQASVFISPYPLNVEAISFLKQSGLMDYIRIIRADNMDDDKDLRKKFQLGVKNK